MNRTLTVAGKELRSSLSSPVAYIFLGVFAIASWFIFFFTEKFFALDEASLRGLFHWMPWLLLFLAPPLTMRLWADERRMGTWEILATTPVTAESLVAGKFLGPKFADERVFDLPHHPGAVGVVGEQAVDPE